MPNVYTKHGILKDGWSELPAIIRGIMRILK
jgi:hypothetical protein